MPNVFETRIYSGKGVWGWRSWTEEDCNLHALGCLTSEDFTLSSNCNSQATVMVLGERKRERSPNLRTKGWLRTETVPPMEMQLLFPRTVLKSPRLSVSFLSFVFKLECTATLNSQRNSGSSGASSSSFQTRLNTIWLYEPINCLNFRYLICQMHCLLIITLESETLSALGQIPHKSCRF